MKKMTIGLALTLITTNLFASTHQEILKQVDLLVARDSYEKAFACGEKALRLERACWENECNDTHIESQITTCGKLTTITTVGDAEEDESYETQFTKALYIKLKGNPLRILEDTTHKFKDSGLNWVAAQHLKLNYMGAMRKALRITGSVEICIEDGEIPKVSSKNLEECTRAPIEVVVVEGVPFLAKIPSINISIDGFTINQNLIEFSGKE